MTSPSTFSPSQPPSAYLRARASRSVAWRLVLHDVRRHKWATFLTLLAAVVPLSVLLVTATALGSFDSLRASHLVNPEGYTVLTVDDRYRGTKGGELVTLDDLDRHAAATSLQTFASYGITSSVDEARQETFHVMHLGHDAVSVVGLQLVDGRWPRSADEAVVAPHGRFGSLEAGESFSVSTLAGDVTYTVVGHGAGAAITRHDTISVPEVFTHAEGPAPPPASVTNWMWLSRPPPEDKLHKAFSNPSQGANVPVFNWHFRTNTTPGAPYSIERSQQAKVVETVERTAMSPALWAFFALTAGLLVAPTMLLAARRHRRNLTLLHSVGGTQGDLRRVLATHAIAMAVATLILVAALSAGGIVAVERLMRSPSVGFYTYGTSVNVAAVGLCVISVFASLMVTARLVSRSVTSATSSTSHTGWRSAFATLVSPGWVAVGAVLLIAICLRTSIGLAFFVAGVLLAGCIVLSPAVLVWLSKATSNTPVVVRLGLRDAAAHTTRSVSYLGAVAATTTLAITLPWLSAHAVALYTSANFSPTFPSSDVVEYEDHTSVRYDRRSSPEDVRHDAAAVAQLPVVQKATVSHEARSLPENTTFYTLDDSPASEPFSTGSPEPIRDVMVAVHPSCSVDVAPDSVEESAQVGFVQCSENFTGALSDTYAVNGLYSLDVGTLSTDEAKATFRLTDEQATQYARGAAIVNTNHTSRAAAEQLEQVKVMAWQQLTVNDNQWALAAPSSQQVLPSILVGSVTSSESDKSVYVAPEVAKQWGLGAEPNRLDITYTSPVTQQELRTVYGALSVDAPEMLYQLPQRTISIRHWQITGGVVGLVLVFVVLSLLTAAHVALSRSGFQAVADIGGKRHVQAVHALQMGFLATCGVAVGVVAGLAAIAARVQGSGPFDEPAALGEIAGFVVSPTEWASISVTIVGAIAVTIALSSVLAPTVTKTVRRTS